MNEKGLESKDAVQWSQMDIIKVEYLTNVKKKENRITNKGDIGDLVNEEGFYYWNIRYITLRAY